MPLAKDRRPANPRAEPPRAALREWCPSTGERPPLGRRDPRPQRPCGWCRSAGGWGSVSRRIHLHDMRRYRFDGLVPGHFVQWPTPHYTLSRTGAQSQQSAPQEQSMGYGGTEWAAESAKDQGGRLSVRWV